MHVTVTSFKTIIFPQKSLDELANLVINVSATAALVAILLVVEITADTSGVAKVHSTLPPVLLVSLLTQLLVGRCLKNLIQVFGRTKYKYLH